MHCSRAMIRKPAYCDCVDDRAQARRSKLSLGFSDVHVFTQLHAEILRVRISSSVQRSSTSSVIKGAAIDSDFRQSWLNRRRIVGQLDDLSEETQRLAIHLPAQARRAGRVEEVAAAPSLHRQTVEHAMNEAETRAEHIDPALRRRAGASSKAAASGASTRSRRAASKATAGAARPLTADYVLEYRNTKLAVIEAKAWDEAADRRRGAGQELRRQAGHPLHLRHQRPGHLRHRHADGQGRRAAALPHAR